MCTGSCTLFQVALCAYTGHDDACGEAPNLLAEFKSGKCVVYQTSNKFSAMATDLCHEQNSAVIKASGGAVGLLEIPGAL